MDTVQECYEEAKQLLGGKEPFPFRIYMAMGNKKLNYVITKKKECYGDPGFSLAGVGWLDAALKRIKGIKLVSVQGTPIEQLRMATAANPKVEEEPFVGTLQECHDKAGGFPFLVKYQGGFELEKDLNLNLILAFVEGSWYASFGNHWSGTTPEFTLVDYFDNTTTLSKEPGTCVCSFKGLGHDHDCAWLAERKKA